MVITSEFPFLLQPLQRGRDFLRFYVGMGILKFLPSIVAIIYRV